MKRPKGLPILRFVIVGISWQFYNNLYFLSPIPFFRILFYNLYILMFYLNPVLKKFDIQI